MRLFLFFLTAVAVILLAGCSDNIANAIVAPPAIPTLDVATITSDINHGTRVDVVVTNPTDQAIGGVILGVTNSSDTSALVELWYGLNDGKLEEIIPVESGQKYYPGLTVRRDNGGDWYWTDDAINGEDGLIIGDLAPHATVETRSWFITF